MKTIKIKFVDFNAPTFDAENQWVTKVLRERYNVEFSEEPEFIFYSTWGLNFRNYPNAVKIFCGGEAVSPNFNECDFAFGFEPIYYNDRFCQYPLGDSDSPGLYDITRSIQDRSAVSADLLERKFCNFVYSQDWMGEGAILRREFCKVLMGYKHVDCPSYVMNNMPRGTISDRWTGLSCGNGTVSSGWSDGKLEFLRRYKFTIAFENTALSGYTTEKIIQPFQAFSIPIYWGNPDILSLFNPKAFINCNEYGNDFESIIERVKELDNDNDKYLEMLSQPPMQESFDFDRREKAKEFLYKIIERGPYPFAKDALRISSSYRTFNEYNRVTEELNTTKEAMKRMGYDSNSNTWKLVQKLQRFGDSKWGYIPKRIFHILIRIYKKLKIVKARY
ncbi:glycosyltransferase family 10 domain-containing protein [Enterocloster lavalensis]|uniref:glycosyltransferase family 10 domain-containing protein n=1 Tax=Enterocloster lavalensis TaxID=460384 RepID=UPI0034A48B18